MKVHKDSHASMKSPEKQYRFFPLIAAVFVTCLIVSNIVAVKLIAIGPFTLTAALPIFSISYIFGDILTEVYGYARARQVIWIGFGCNLLAVGAFYLAAILPPSGFWVLPGFDSPAQAQSAFEAILGFAPLVLGASFLAYLAGEFLNAYVLARMKIAMKGRWLWTRTIGSTVVAQIADTGIFVGVLVVGGLIIPAAAFPTILGEWTSKVLYEVLATPITYLVVGFLKRTEQQDHYDHDTNFNPLVLADK